MFWGDHGHFRAGQAICGHRGHFGTGGIFSGAVVAFLAVVAVFLGAIIAFSAVVVAFLEAVAGFLGAVVSLLPSMVAM